MNNLESIVNVEKSKMQEFQSKMDKLINTIKQYNSNIDKDNLTDIILLNQNIQQLINQIEDTEMNILSNKKKHIYKKDFDRLKEYNKTNLLIKKYLPIMMLDSFHSK